MEVRNLELYDTAKTLLLAIIYIIHLVELVCQVMYS